MFEIIISAIGTGIFISLFLIGPVFFCLIETSLTKGYKAAFALDLGVILSDILCVSMAYYSSQDIQNYIKEHPSLYTFGGFFVIFYGIFMIFSNKKEKLNKNKFNSTNYLKTFINGFILNIANVGVLAFWISIVFLIKTQFGNQNFKFFIFILINFITLIIIDLYKIFLARLLKNKLTDRLVNKIKKIIAFLLVIFGVFFLLKSFKTILFQEKNKQIESNIPLQIFSLYKKL